MNDDDRTQLASAYLDDEATLDERAIVEGDPTVLAEVDRLRSLRALLGDVEPAPISARERHLAAALDAWDRIPDAERTGARRDATPPGVDAAAVAAAASVSAPPRNSGRRRRGTSTTWMSAAAAGLIVILAVGVVLQLSTDGDDDSASVVLSQTLSTDDQSAAPRAGDETEPDAASAAEEATSEFADDILETEISANDGELDTGIDNPAPPADDDLAVLRTTDDLAAFASDAIDAPRAPDGPAATSAPTDDAGDGSRSTTSGVTQCPGIDIVVGPAVYGETEVVVGIDESRDLAIASTPTDCREVARAPLP